MESEKTETPENIYKNIEGTQRIRKA